jgi:hypothetical protein
MATQTASPFLNLAAELRNAIYELVIDSENHVTLTPEGRIKEPALAAVNRQIRSELLPMFQAKNKPSKDRVTRVIVTNLNFDRVERFVRAANSKPQLHIMLKVFEPPPPPPPPGKRPRPSLRITCLDPENLAQWIADSSRHYIGFASEQGDLSPADLEQGIRYEVDAACTEEQVEEMWFMCGFAANGLRGAWRWDRQRDGLKRLEKVLSDGLQARRGARLQVERRR